MGSLLLDSIGWPGRAVSVADVVVAEYLTSILCLSCLDGLSLRLAALLALPRALLLAAERGQVSGEQSFKSEPLHNRYSHFHRGWVEENLRL